MYPLIAVLIAAVFGFALAGSFNFFLTFIIAFFAAFCLLTFVDTMINGENLAFAAGCVAFKGLAKLWLLWLFYFSPAIIFVLIAIVGGIITAPIWYFISNSKTTTVKKTVLLVMVAALSILFVAGIALLVSPISVYRIIHYGWIIGLFIAIPIISFIISLVLKGTGMIKGGTLAMLIVACVVLIPMMIVGVSNSKNATYEIYTAEDMKAFGNAPTNYNTVFMLMNDIDFTDKDVSWFGGQKEFEGIFDGQGYTLSNIVVKTKCKTMREFSLWGANNSPQGLGFVRSNTGIIRNLNFEDCKFTITNKSSSITNYDMHFGIIAAENLSGKIYNCDIINCQAKYQISSGADAHMSLSVGTNNSGHSYGGSSGEIDDVNVVNDKTLDESFYTEDDLTWNKIG